MINKLGYLPKLNIAALTDHLNTPSSRFRVRQYIENISQYGVEVTDFWRRYSTESAGRIFPDKKISKNIPKLLTAAYFELLNLQNSLSRVLLSRNYDAVWISREIVIGYPTFERLLKKPLIYDIDDAIFLGAKKNKLGVRRLIENSAVVFAGNDYLVDYCSQYSSKVLKVPTAVDTYRFVIPETKKNNEKFVVGWSGTSSSYKYFIPLERGFEKFFKEHPDAVLKICSDKFPIELPRLAPYIDFEYWSAAKEVDQIQSFDVGIMPLENSEWTKGKCAYKFLLYAACGIPVISSLYGMNKEVLALGRVGVGCESPEQWFEALNYFYESREILADIFPDCRQVVLDNFSIDIISRRISLAMLNAI